MVAFTRLQSAQRQHLTIHAREWSNGGFRLIVAYPNGLRKVSEESWSRNMIIHYFLL